jgi:hypothetical protein
MSEQGDGFASTRRGTTVFSNPLWRFRAISDCYPASREEREIFIIHAVSFRRAHGHAGRSWIRSARIHDLRAARPCAAEYRCTLVEISCNGVQRNVLPFNIAAHVRAMYGRPAHVAPAQIAQTSTSICLP